MKKKLLSVAATVRSRWCFALFALLLAPSAFAQSVRDNLCNYISGYAPSMTITFTATANVGPRGLDTPPFIPLVSPSGEFETPLWSGTWICKITSDVDEVSFPVHSPFHGGVYSLAYVATHNLQDDVISGAAAPTPSVAVGLIGLIGSGTVDSAIAFGLGTSATNAGAIAIGHTAQATNTFAVALGYSASAGGVRSVAIGREASATATRAVAIGPAAVADLDNEITLGSTLQYVHIPTRLGVGTNAPVYLLHIFTTSTNAIRIDVAGNGVGAVTNVIDHWIPAILNGTNGFIPFYKK